MSAATKTPPALEGSVNDVAVAEPAPAEERVVAFTIGATPYTIPARIPVGWALTYLRLHYGSDQDHALIWMLTRLLGNKQHNALENDPDLTQEGLARAISACRLALLGELEDPKGP
jgi:hypothetical protein